MDIAEVLEDLKQFDTPSVTNVVATYPQDGETCLGLYHPWRSKWYTDETLKCMFPEFGSLAGYAVTVTFGLPDADFDRLKFLNLYQAIEKMPKPVILVIKQNFPEEIKKKNGLCGGNMMTAFQSLGVVGVISDGPSRDLGEVRELGMQYMLTGVCAGHGDFAIQEINTPVEVCGMEVMPGNMIHMDENGAVKFPVEYAQEISMRCHRLRTQEELKQKRLSEHKESEILARIMSDTYE